MSALDRLADVKGLDAAGIAKAFDDVEQDEITAAIVDVFAARTTIAALPKRPFVVHHTMYGDLDVSDFVIAYTDAGATTADASTVDPSTVDVHLRWEHWEDAVRLLNGDTGEVALFFARRIEALDDEAMARRWTAAVDFAGTGDLESRPSVLADRLRSAAERGEAAVAAFIAEKGLPTLVAARAANMAGSVYDVGAGGPLAGTTIRVVVEARPTVAAETAFPADGGTPVTSVVPEATAGDDPSDAVVLRYASVDAFVDAVTFRQEMSQQVTNGQLRVLGPNDRVTAFGMAMMRLYDAPRPKAT